MYREASSLTRKIVDCIVLKSLAILAIRLALITPTNETYLWKGIKFLNRSHHMLLTMQQKFFGYLVERF